MKRFVWFLLFLLTWSLLPGSAAACECAGGPTAEEAFRTQGAVFAGKVKNIRTWKQDGRAGDEAIFEVETSWKGISSKQVAVRTEWSSCSVKFQQGESYVLYAHGDGGAWMVNQCSRMLVRSEAEADIQTLSALAAPQLLNEADSPPANYKLYAGAAAGAGVLLYVWKRKRRQ